MKLMVGDVLVEYILDGYVELDPEGWFRRHFPADRWSTNDRGFLVGTVGCVIIHDGDLVITVDAGLGPLNIPGTQTHPSLGVMRGGRLAEFIASIPSNRSWINLVTHAHEDHVGWLREWRQGHRVLPSLPGQTVFVGRPDVDRLASMGVSRRIVPLDGSELVSPSVRAIASPGHTAGHTSYLVESRGERLLLFGDVFHNPGQIGEPELTPWSDEVPVVARESRKETLRLLSEGRTVGFGYHFAGAHFGRLIDESWHTI